MNEPQEQSIAGETGQEQSLELADGLLRRSAEPVGVIDTRHPRQMYDRTAGLVARRFAMLDHWRTRYIGVENPAAPRSDAGLDLASASAPLDALRRKVASAPPVSPRSVTPGASAQTIAQVTTQASPPTASPIMRVMRRTARPADAAHPSSIPSSHPPIIGGGAGQGSIEAPGDSTPMALAGVGGEVVVSPADTQVQRKQSGVGNSDAGSGGAGKPADPTVRAETAGSHAPALIRGRVVDTAAAAIQPSIPLAVPPAALPISAARAQRKADEAPGLRKGKVLDATVADVAARRTPLPAPAPPLTPTPGVSRLPLASAPIQRQAAPRETRGPSSGETHAPNREDRIDNSAAASTLQSPGGKPAATEIPAPSSAQAPPKIVWRKGAESSSTTSPPQSAMRENVTPGAPMIARQNEGESNQTAGTFTQASPPAPSGSGGGGVDVEQLAEQVSRLLARQLQIERERRGMF